MKIDRKQILNSVLETIEGISNKNYQERVWIRGEGPEVDDFDETACHFLHEGSGVLEKYKDFEISEAQYLQLKKFREKFEAFSDEHSYEPAFIDTPEWDEIREMAKDVLKAFNYSQKRD